MTQKWRAAPASGSAEYWRVSHPAGGVRMPPAPINRYSQICEYRLSQGGEMGWKVKRDRASKVRDSVSRMVRSMEGAAQVMVDGAEDLRAYVSLMSPEDRARSASDNAHSGAMSGCCSSIADSWMICYPEKDFAEKIRFSVKRCVDANTMTRG